MRHFLLVHGSWHGAWCWFKIKPRLEAEGHRVTVPNLPGRGQGAKHLHSVGLQGMISHVSKLIPSGQKTTIVVHSRYGILASQLAEAFPDRIDRVIYLASFMLPDGMRAASCFRSDKNSLLTDFVEVSWTGLWDRLSPEIYKEGLYHDCTEDDIALASSLLCKEPLRPAIAKLKLSQDRYGQVQKAYIRLTEDRAVSINLQDRLLNKMKVSRVESIKASHSAYFSEPDELTSTILKLCKP